MKHLKVLSSESRWRIVELLSKEEKTVTELAGALHTSISNITQQLSELESLKLVKKSGTERGRRRPFTKYSLDKGFILVVEALPKRTRKIFLEANEDVLVQLSIWSIPQKEFHYYVEKFWWDIQDYRDYIEAFAVFGSVARGDARSDSDIDVLILAKKNIKQLEKKFGAKIIGPKRRGKMVMAQVFTSEEFEGMIKSGSKFAKEILSNIISIYDPNEIL